MENTHAENCPLCENMRAEQRRVYTLNTYIHSFSEVAQRGREELNKELMVSVKAGDIERVISHLEEGADTTNVDSNGDTSLHLAAERGHDQVLETLL